MKKMTNEDLNDLIAEIGGPIYTIESLISNLSDENLQQTTEYIKYILSVRTVHKKTYLGDENFYDYLTRNGINI
jgi:hypothetical protein